MQPFFSIITPVLNRLDLIKKAIDSVEIQLFTNFEHIIIDNGSTDGTFEYCKSLNNKRTKVIQCKQKGVAFARNTGIKEAAGKWIIILDSDNQLLSEKTLLHLKELTTKFVNAHCIFTSNIDEEGRIVSFSNKMDTYLTVKEYLYSSGEFTPLVQREWYLKNLHTEIKGVINEFSQLVFIEAAIKKSLVLSSYIAQIYCTIGEDRICSSQISAKKAFELSTYYKLLLSKYGKFVAQNSCKIYFIWSLKILLYGKISNEIHLKEMLRTKIFLGVIPFWILPKRLITYLIEYKK